MCRQASASTTIKYSGLPNSSSEVGPIGKVDLMTARPALAGDPQRDSPSVPNMARLTTLVHSSISRDMREVQASQHLSSRAQQGAVVNSFIDCPFVPRHTSAVSPRQELPRLRRFRRGDGRGGDMQTPEDTRTRGAPSGSLAMRVGQVLTPLPGLALAAAEGRGAVVSEVQVQAAVARGAASVANIETPGR